MNELIIWENQTERYEVSLNYMPLFDVDVMQSSQMSMQKLFKTDNKSIDVLDIEFNKKIKKAERDDYLASIASGLIAAAFDQFAVGKTNLEHIKDLDKKELFELVKSMLVLGEFNQQKINVLENEFNKSLDHLASKINKASNYKALIKDFSHSLSIKGLVYSIISKLIGYTFGLGEDGKLAFTPIDDAEKNEGRSYKQRIIAGFVSWLVFNAGEYAKNGKFAEEKADILRFKKGFAYVKSVIKEIADSHLFKDKKIDQFEIYDKIMDKVTDIDKDVDDSFDMKKIMSKQILPVVLNKCLVRIWCFIKLLVSEIKERNVKSIEGLDFININIFSDTNKRVISRMDLVSSGVFGAIDGVEAIAYATKKAAETEGDEKEKLIAGVYAYLSSINLANAFNLVTVVKNDGQYLLEDVQQYINENTVAKLAADEKAREIEKKLYIDYVGLNNVETRILYSLQLQLINEDIDKTKDSETQITKNEWKKLWVEQSKKAVEINRLFDEDPEKTYAMLKTHAATAGDKSWLYKIALELLLFKPYYQLDEDEKKYKKLKTVDGSYIKTVFCNNQDIITEKDIDNLNKTYKKSFNLLEKKNEKTAAGVAGAVAVTAAASVAAFTFAPAIAVALAGSAFSGLSGAALTSASLAFFGGGAIAAGGFGMAGGAIVIAGGGALVGLGTSGAALASLSLLSSPSFTQKDYAKLITTVEYILDKKCNLIKEIELIKKETDHALEQFKFELSVIKNAQIIENKKEYNYLVSNLEKSISIVERAKDYLNSKYSKD